MREALDDDKLLDEAEVEHQAAKDLIAQIQDSDPGDALYDARINVLGEYVKHHVQEEEGELFPRFAIGARPRSARRRDERSARGTSFGRSGRRRGIKVAAGASRPSLSRRC